MPDSNNNKVKGVEFKYHSPLSCFGCKRQEFSGPGMAGKMRSANHHQAKRRHSDSVYLWFGASPECRNEGQYESYKTFSKLNSVKALCSTCEKGYDEARNIGLRSLEEARSLPAFAHLPNEEKQKFAAFPKCSSNFCAKSVLSGIQKFKDKDNHYWLHFSSTVFAEVFERYKSSFVIGDKIIENSSFRQLRFLHWLIQGICRHQFSLSIYLNLKDGFVLIATSLSKAFEVVDPEILLFCRR